MVRCAEFAAAWTSACSRTLSQGFALGGIAASNTILYDDASSVAQCEAARQLAMKAGEVYVAQVVQVETVWLLESVYRFGRAELADALRALTINRGYVLQRPETFREALQQFRTGTADFSDCVILAELIRQSKSAFLRSLWGGQIST